MDCGLRDSYTWRLLTRYPRDVLAHEMRTMNDCAECHEPAQFHTCETCHDDHGAIEMESVPFYAGTTFAGDVPVPGYVLIDDVLLQSEDDGLRSAIWKHSPQRIEISNDELQDAIIALKKDGEWITKAEPDKGPLRLVCPETPASRWIFQIQKIQVNP